MFLWCFRAIELWTRFIRDTYLAPSGLAGLAARCCVETVFLFELAHEFLFTNLYKVQPPNQIEVKLGSLDVSVKNI